MEYKLEQQDIEKMDSINLASMVVLNRALGSFRQEAKLCMIELMKRKSAGDAFDFETFIAENSEKYKIKLNLQSFATIKSKISTTLMKSIIDIGSGKSIDVEEAGEEDEDDF